MRCIHFQCNYSVFIRSVQSRCPSYTVCFSGKITAWPILSSKSGDVQFRRTEIWMEHTSDRVTSNRFQRYMCTKWPRKSWRCCMACRTDILLIVLTQGRHQQRARKIGRGEEQDSEPAKPATVNALSDHRHSCLVSCLLRSGGWFVFAVAHLHWYLHPGLGSCKSSRQRSRQSCTGSIFIKCNRVRKTSSF